MRMNLGIKWFIGSIASTSVFLDDTLRTLGLVLGLVVAGLTIANLAWDLYRKFTRKK